MNEEIYQEFLFDLEALYREYGIVISACGCCNSPFLVPVEEIERRHPQYSNPVDDHLEHLRTTLNMDLEGTRING